jgi:hypothetical protein
MQEVIGTFLVYARRVNSTMLTALRSLATQQANPTTNTKKNGPSISGLCGDTSRCNHHISGKQHGPCRTQQHFLPVRDQCTQLSRRKCLHVKQQCTTSKQWCSPHHCTNHQGRNVVSSGSRYRRSIHKLSRGHPCSSHTRIFGPHTTFHSNANQQHHCP